ncbi:glycosyltransferase [Marinomonas agarivorans]|nr:glycosyltransferase [Marinomonas agarivorans]
MKVSLIITTYNWKDALVAVLKSVEKQTVLPNEVIVADDGSRSDTKTAIQEIAKNFPVPLIHSWQEDKGFRAAKSRNQAALRTSTEYIIYIDGDIILHPDFIKDHIRSAKDGYFIQGGRVKLNKARSQKVLDDNLLPSFFSTGVKNRKNTISNPYMSNIFSRVWNSDISTRSCNFGLWKSDLFAVNGFNEEFEGWGREDSELVIRLLNLGRQRIYLKFAAVGYHLYHEENTRAQLDENDLILQNTIENSLTRCELGLDQYRLLP